MHDDQRHPEPAPGLRRRADLAVTVAVMALAGVPFLLLAFNALAPVAIAPKEGEESRPVWRFTAPAPETGNNWLDEWRLVAAAEEAWLPRFFWSRRPGYDQGHQDKRNLPMHFAALATDPQQEPERPYIKDVLKGHFITRRFGLRSLLIDLGAHVKLDLFKVSSSGRVILGRSDPVPGPDGAVRELTWLFIKSKAGVTREMRRDLPFQKDELRALVDTFVRNTREMKKRGLPYVVVVAPNKASIYPEKLPGWIRPTAGRSRMDQLLDALAALPPKDRVDILDLRPAILAAKEAEAVAATAAGRPPRPLYQLFDTHWTDLAAFPAYQEIIAHLSAQYPASCNDLHPRDLSAMHCGWSERAEPGDLSTFLHMQRDPRFREHIWEIVPRHGTGNTEEGKVIPVIDTGTGDPSQPRALVLRDSFCQRLVPYLSLHFHSVRYRWHNELLLRVRNPQGELVTFSQHLEEWRDSFGGKPDLVIQQLVERWLVDDPYVFADTRQFPVVVKGE